jgi:ABC-type antimicrobial peptide transport system permease subunit
MYSLRLALKQFKHKISTYTIIILEIGIGLAVLMVSLNLIWSINDRLLEINKDKKNKTYYLEGAQYVDFNFSNLSDSGRKNIEINRLEDYNYLVDTYGDKLEVLQFRLVSLTAKLNNETKEILVFYTTPEFFKFVFNDEKTIFNDNQIYAGRKAYEAIKKHWIMDVEMFDYYEIFDNYNKENETITLLDNTKLELNLYEPGTDERVMMYYRFFIHEFDPDYSIILPSKQYNTRNADGVAIYVNTLGIYFPEEDPYFKLDIINHFNNKYYSDSSQRFSYLKAQSIWDVNVLKYREIGELLKIISVFSIIIVTVGLFAYNLMQFNKRKKSIAIKKSIGCSDGKVLLENIIESCIVSLLGGVLGIALGLIVSNLNLFHNDFFVFKIHYSIIFIFIVISIGIGIVTNLAIHLKIKKLKPMQLLKE